jgi:HEAT repeat protein
MCPYNPTQRLTAIFLLLSVSLQSCIPPLKLVYEPLSKEGELHSSAQDTPTLHPAKVLRQAEIAPYSFIASSKEAVTFFQEEGVWKANIQDPWIGTSFAKGVPVVCELQEDLGHMLQRLPQEASKQRIHILNTLQGKCVYVGDFGLKGGMQPAIGESSFPLHEAAAAGNLELVRQILGTGLEPNAEDQDGFTPLHYAAENGHQALGKLLLDQGADPNKAGKYGYVPLHWAAICNHIEVVSVLLDSGSDANKIAHNGFTALHLAAHKGHSELVKLLLARGADLHKADKQGDTPLDVAKKNAQKTVIALLQEAILREVEEEKIPLSQADVEIDSKSAALFRPSMLNKAADFPKISKITQTIPKGIGGDQAWDEKIDPYLEALAAKVQLSLKENYQRSFSEVKPWFDYNQVPLPIEKAKCYLLDLGDGYTIELSDLFKPIREPFRLGYRQVHKVLLTGNPGIGKTTLSHKLAYLWSQGKIDPSLKTLYILPIKELQHTHYDNSGHFKKNATLATAITNNCFPDVNEEEVYHGLRTSIQKTLHWPSTLVVLDGLDARRGASERIIAEAQQGNHKLLMLSRSDGAEELRKCIDIHREVVHTGFGQSQIGSYVYSYFSGNTDKARDLLQFFKQYPGIGNLAQVPITLDLLCGFWSHAADQLQATKGSPVRLYSQLADYLWKRYTEEYHTRHLADYWLQNIHKDEVFDALGELALSGLAGGEELIRGKTVEGVLDKLAKDKQIHVMLVESKLLEKVGMDYQFPHLSFQKYFAGRALAKSMLAGNDLGEITVKEFLSAHKYQQKYQGVLAFLADVVSQVQGEEGIAKLLKMLQEGPKEVIGLQQLFSELRCLNSYLSLYPGFPERIEKEFACMDKLERWFIQGLKQIICYNNMYLLDILVSTLQSMPAVAKEAQDVQSVLLKAAGDKAQEYQVRSAAIRALGELVQAAPDRAPAVQAVLLSGVRDANYRIRSAAIKSLGELVQAAPGQAKAVLSTLKAAAYGDLNNSIVCLSAIQSLVELVQADPRQAKAVLPTLQTLAIEDLYSWSTHVNRSAIRGLVKLVQQAPGQASKILPTLLLLARTNDRSCDPINDLSELAIDSLGKLLQVSPDQGSAALSIVLKAAKSWWPRNLLLRNKTIDLLGELLKSVPDQVETVLPTILGATEDENHDVRSAAIKALGGLVKISPAHVPVVKSALFQAARDKDNYVRSHGISALGDLVKAEPAYAPVVKSALFQAARDKDNYVRSLGIAALGDFVQSVPNQVETVLPTILGATEDENHYVRSAAIKALGGLVKISPAHTPVIQSALLKVAKGKDWYSRSLVINVLGDLVKAEPSQALSILEVLVKAARDDQFGGSTAIHALEELVKAAPAQAGAVVPVLLQAIWDQDTSTSLDAIKALGTVLQAAPDQATAVLPILQSAGWHQNISVRYRAIKIMGELVKAAPDQAMTVLPILLETTQDESTDRFDEALGRVKHYPVRSAAIEELNGFPLAKLTQNYFTNPAFINNESLYSNKLYKRLSYIVNQGTQVPLVLEDSKEGFQKLVVHTSTGLPEVVGEYPIQAVARFLQHIEAIQVRPPSNENPNNWSCLLS